MLTNAQVREAVEQMKIHCELKMPNYEAVSARSCLTELGYFGDDEDQVLKAIYDAGFTYCFDHEYPATHFTRPDKLEYPSADVCYWGPDQLKSRLNAIGWKLPKE